MSTVTMTDSDGFKVVIQARELGTEVSKRKIREFYQHVWAREAAEKDESK